MAFQGGEARGGLNAAAGRAQEGKRTAPVRRGRGNWPARQTRWVAVKKRGEASENGWQQKAEKSLAVSWGERSWITLRSIKEAQKVHRCFIKQREKTTLKEKPTFTGQQVPCEKDQKRKGGGGRGEENTSGKMHACKAVKSERAPGRPFQEKIARKC